MGHSNLAFTAQRRSPRSIGCVVTHVAYTLDQTTMVVIEYGGIVRGPDAQPRVSSRTRMRGVRVYSLV